MEHKDKNSLPKFRFNEKQNNSIYFYTSAINYSMLKLKFTVRLSHRKNAENESLKISINKESDSMEEVEKRL